MHVGRAVTDIHLDQAALALVLQPQQQARSFALVGLGRGGGAGTRCNSGLHGVCIAVDIQQAHAVAGGGEGGGRRDRKDRDQGCIDRGRSRRRGRPGSQGKDGPRDPWRCEQEGSQVLGNPLSLVFAPRRAGCGTSAHRRRSGR